MPCSRQPSCLLNNNPKSRYLIADPVQYGPLKAPTKRRLAVIIRPSIPALSHVPKSNRNNFGGNCEKRLHAPSHPGPVGMYLGRTERAGATHSTYRCLPYPLRKSRSRQRCRGRRRPQETRSQGTDGGTLHCPASPERRGLGLCCDRASRNQCNGESRGQPATDECARPKRLAC